MRLNVSEGPEVKNHEEAIEESLITAPSDLGGS